MKRLESFRIFYNQTIHPELVRLERHRQRLLRLLFFSALILAGVLAFQFYLRILPLTLVMIIPIVGYIAYLFYRIRVFIRTFKPQVMNLILDFIDDGPNRGEMKYVSDKKLEKGRFLESRLFVTKAPFYVGEDYIAGSVGQMAFELCELDVREISQVRSRLDTVFKGIFLRGIFGEEATGEVVVWPRETRQYNTRSIREFTWKGGKNVDHEILNDRFRGHFMTFATEDTHVAGLLTEPMQESVVNYRAKTGKYIYLSFKDQELFIAVTEEKDILEPYIFRSNLSFELVREFMEDIDLLLEIVEEFDKTH